jgi:RNA polymerase sigma factor (sigma-70 family)
MHLYWCVRQLFASYLHYGNINMQITPHDIQALQANKPHAQKKVFDALYARLFRVSLRYMAQTDEAEDCLMRAYLKAFTEVKHTSITSEDELIAWMKRIVVNESLMVIRKTKPYRIVQIEDVLEQPIAFDFMHTLHAEDVMKLITQLPAGYRTVFNMYVVEGYSHQEIAAQLAISENTSKTQLYKAKQRLQLMIKNIERRAANG